MATIRHGQPHPTNAGLIWDATRGRFKPLGQSTGSRQFPGTVRASDLMGSAGNINLGGGTSSSGSPFSNIVPSQLAQQLQTPANRSLSPTFTRFADKPTTTTIATDWSGLESGSFFNGDRRIVFDAATGRYVPSSPFGGVSQAELDAANATLTGDTTGTGDIGTGDIGTGDIGAGDIGTGDIGAGDIGAGDIGTGDIGAGDIGAGDIGAGDIGAGYVMFNPGDLVDGIQIPTSIPEFSGMTWFLNGTQWKNMGDGQILNMTTGKTYRIRGLNGEETDDGGNGETTVTTTPPGPFTGHEDVKKMVTDMINFLLAQGELNAESFNTLLGRIDSLLDSTVGTGAERDKLQRDLVQQLLKATLPGLKEAMGRADEGLSPEARAALQTRAIEDPARLGEPARQDMMKQLLRTGALGGQIPGSPSDITRAFGDLAAKREGLRSQGLTGVALADEEQRTLNRQQALQAAQIQADLLGTAGALLDPTAFLNTTANLLGISQNVLATFTQSQNDALRTVGEFMRTRADLEPESLKGIIASGLLQGVPGILDSLPNLVRMIKGLATDEVGDLTKSLPRGGVVGAAMAKLFGAKLGALLVNPWFWGPAAVGGMALLANHFIGQGRKAADTWVFDIQKPFSDQLERINQGVDVRGSGVPRAEDALRQLRAIGEYWNQGASALATREGRFPGVIQAGVNTMNSLWNATWQTYLKEVGRPNDPIPPLRAA